MYVVGAVIVTVGAPRSIVHVSLAGVPSVLPAASVALTSKVWLPPPSGLVAWGLVHAAHVPASTRHSKVEPPSLEWNVKVGVASLSSAGGAESIVVSGAVRSTVQVCDAGEPSVLPARSVARTSKVWLPSGSALVVFGLVQVLQLPPSMRHSKLDPPSLELKVKLGVALFEGSAGPESMLVSGAVLSTRRFATRSAWVCPTMSVATARTSYIPSATALVFQLAVYGEVVSVPIVVRVAAPAGERSKTTCWTAVDASDALALSDATPASGVPGSVSDTDGLSVSTFAVALTGAETCPTLSAIVNV